VRATFTVEVPDEFVEERARQFSAEVEEHEGATSREFFEGRCRDVADDELPVAFYGWPVNIGVAFACSCCGWPDRRTVGLCLECGRS
jgi:hypothetical protein